MTGQEIVTVQLTSDEICALDAAVTNERELLVGMREWDKNTYPSKDLKSALGKLRAAMHVLQGAST